MLKKLFYTFLFLISLCFSVNAKELYYVDKYFTNEGQVTLKYSVSPSEDTSLMILKNEENWDEIHWKDAENNKNLVYNSVEKFPDENGEFNIILKNEGKYVAFLNSESNNKIYHFMCADYGNGVKLLKELVSLADSGEDLTKTIDDNKNALMIYTDLYAKDNKNVGKYVKDYIKNNNVDLVMLPDILNKAYFIDSLNQGTVKTADYLYSAGIKGTKLEKYYDGVKDKEQIFNTKGNSIEDYEKNLKENVILSLIENSGNTELICSALKEFPKDTGISVNKCTTEVCQAINGKTFKDYKALETYVNEHIKSENNKEQGGSGGGSGFGGGSSGSQNIGYVSGQSNETKKEPKLFKDLDKALWAEKAITGLYYEGIISGKTADMFFPMDNVKREEYTKMIMELIDTDVLGSEPSFKDVKKDAWYYKYIKSAYNAEIIKGLSEEIFGVGNNITRQDLAVITYNALNVCGIKSENKIAKINFKDENQISDYAKEAVSNLQTRGIINGYDGCFNPKGYATRAEAAKIIFAVLELIK